MNLAFREHTQCFTPTSNGYEHTEKRHNIKGFGLTLESFLFKSLEANLQPKMFIRIRLPINKVYQLIPGIAAYFIYIYPCSTREVANSCIA